MKPISVLVVDDEPGIALLCQRLLTRAGYDVTAMTDPRQAVEYLENHLVDLLLVDIRMPEVDGFEVVAHAHRFQPGIAVLVMTGFGTVETAIRALREGVDGLLLKPFERGSELLDSVKQAMADNQQKSDAARTQALRPLFSVTESLFSETQRDRLLELITQAICGYLKCEHSAVFIAEKDGDLELQAEKGKSLEGAFGDMMAQADFNGASTLMLTTGPRETEYKDKLIGSGFGSAMIIPVRRPRFRSVFLAVRNIHEQPFQESDFEMFQILASQAATALENSRLYAEQLEYVRKIEDSQRGLLQMEKMATAGRLSASIAHEVNNPLQAVQNCLHLAGREDLPAGKRKEYFDLARVELERLMITVQRMLELYRPGSQSTEDVDLGMSLEHVAQLLNKQFSDRRILLQIELPEDLPHVEAVDTQMQQVFINLMLNAYDAMPEGGELRITGQAAAQGVELFFQDSGGGIPSEQQVNIFEPFVSMKEGGTGLGLTVSYNIMTAHGGTLDLVRGRGQGACFRVYVPIGSKP